MIPKELEATILRLYHAERWPIGTIARQVGVHHTTVRRVLAQAGIDAGRVSMRRSIADPFIPFIVETLTEYPNLTSRRLYEMVKERGYPGAPDHFRTVVARYRPHRPAEAFLRLRTLPGEQAQVDWAHFGRLDLGQARRPLMAFVVVLSWSRRIFLQFCLDARMASFLRGHVAAFEHFGGVPRRLLYDNLKSAVLERRGEAIRFNPALLSFASHYRFEPKPVAQARGNEKGRVERAIRYVRSSFFAGRDFSDLDDLNAQALSWCTGTSAERKCPEDRSMTVREAFEAERGKLLPLPEHPFPTDERVEVKVGKTPYVRFDKNDYSVPFDRVRRTLVVMATPKIVRILDGNEVVATHARSYDKGDQIENPAHIQELVEHKREGRRHRGLDRLAHAAPNSTTFFVRMAERGGNIGNATMRLLRLLDAYGADELERAIAEALERGTVHVPAVRQILDRNRHERGADPPVPVALPDDPRVRDLVVKPHALDTYDDLDKETDDDDAH